MFLVAFKLWLVSAQEIFAIGFANYDDALFIRLADFLRQGKWLGPYDHFTLAKGPMYPLFIAAVSALGLPLFPVQHLLYAVACGLLVAALWPLLPGRRLAFILFAVLLFNPVTYDSIIHTRVLRQNLLHSLVLLIVAGLIGLGTRPTFSPRRLLPWALLTGLALPAFWMTREEAVWMLPCIVILWVYAFVVGWRTEAPDRWSRLACLALPGVMWAGGLALVAGLNLHHYGVFTICEVQHPAFKAAYGSLLRVDHAEWRPYIHVPREVRERLYPLSPAFARLQPELEGETGQAWAGVTTFLTHRPEQEREIGSAWFIWAMRRAAYDLGFARTGAEARAYYEQVAREVNAACDRGLLPARPPRTGFLPPLQPVEISRLPGSFLLAVREIVSFANLDPAVQNPGLGQPDELTLFTRLTRGRLGPAADASVPPHRRGWLDRQRMDFLGLITRLYGWVGPWAGGAAVLAWLAAGIIQAWRRPRRFFLIWLGAGLLGSVLAMAAVVALIDVTMFPAIQGGYFTATYALFLLFIFTGGLALARTLRPGPEKSHR